MNDEFIKELNDMVDHSVGFNTERGNDDYNIGYDNGSHDMAYKLKKLLEEYRLWNFTQ